MRILVFSDIHANLTALSAVLNAAGEVDAYWCLGDLIGYGPDPNECIEVVKELPNLTCLIGNHDAAALDYIELDVFNYEARISAQWTKNNLSLNSMAFLNNLVDSYKNEIVTLAHGSPRNPIWEYLLDLQTAKINFGYFDTHLCFVGHTHIPACYAQSANNKISKCRVLHPGESPNLENRAILNPGSVGQPRDHDPRASFAIFYPETLKWEQHRVEYDITSVQRRIINAGLPANHAMRLLEGW